MVNPADDARAVESATRQMDVRRRRQCLWIGRPGNENSKSYNPSEVGREISRG